MKQKNEKNDEKYDLYTEHIVPDTGEKIKQGLKKALMTAVLAVFFGLTAGLVMLLVYHTGRDKLEVETNRPIRLPNNDDEEDESEDVTVIIPENTSPSPSVEPTIEWDEDVKQQLQDMNLSFGALKAVAGRVNKSMVTINKVTDGIAGLGSNYQNSSTAFGIVLAEDTDNYYILTDSYQADGNSSLVVTYNDGTNVMGKFVEKDSTTRLAIVRTSKEKVKDVNVATLGDSESIVTGDITVAVGELYGFTSSMGYGIITGKELIVSDTDSEFKILTTDIIGTEGSFGVLANLNGDVIGIVTTNYNSGTSNHISAYSVKGVTRIIENLMNSKETPYLGIRGQTISKLISQEYGIPEGIYISAVETNSPAYYAGVQPGDIITAINGKQIKDMNKFMEVINLNNVGDSLDIKIKRKGRENYKEIVFTITLGVE